VVEGQISARLEDASRGWEHEIEVGGAAERRGRDAHAARRRGTATTDAGATYYAVQILDSVRDHHRE